MTISADHRKIVFCAEPVGDVSDALIALLTVVIFAVFDIIRSTKNDVIMDVVTVCVGGNHIGVFSSQQFICQILSNLVGFFGRYFAGAEGLDQMEGFVRAAFSRFGQYHRKLIGGSFR